MARRAALLLGTPLLLALLPSAASASASASAADLPSAGPAVDGRLALVRDGSIWTVGADGSLPRQLTSGRRDGRPRWSPDGRRLAFTRLTNGVSQLWLMGADGSGQVRVSPLAGAGRPDWSPDGRTLAFIAAYDRYSAAVHRVSSTAPFGVARVVIENGNDWGTTDGPSPLYAATSFAPDPVPNQLAWSRDGRSLAFFNGSCYAYYERCLDSFDPVTRFTTTLRGTPHTADPPVLESVAWSPDSQTLLTTERQAGGHHLDVGPGLARIADAANGVFAPSGTRIAFTRVQHGTTWVWTSRTDGTDQVRVAAGSIPDW